MKFIVDPVIVNFESAEDGFCFDCFCRSFSRRLRRSLRRGVCGSVCHNHCSHAGRRKRNSCSSNCNVCRGNCVGNR
ncbi:MAG: hypothetical protein LBJ83_01100 [Oscillospiraceae bacterium]|nr:hypothetical protein [Oscillospiraceae bacterium]